VAPRTAAVLQEADRSCGQVEQAAAPGILPWLQPVRRKSAFAPVPAAVRFGTVAVTAVNRLDRHAARASCNCSATAAYGCSDKAAHPRAIAAETRRLPCKPFDVSSKFDPASLFALFIRRVFSAGNLHGLCTQQLAGFCHSRLKGGSLQSTPHGSSDGVSRQLHNVTRNAANWEQVSFTATNAPDNGQSLSLVSLAIKFFCFHLMWKSYWEALMYLKKLNRMGSSCKQTKNFDCCRHHCIQHSLHYEVNSGAFEELTQFLQSQF
jgi:hypothetical protein